MLRKSLCETLRKQKFYELCVKSIHQWVRPFFEFVKLTLKSIFTSFYISYISYFTSAPGTNYFCVDKLFILYPNVNEYYNAHMEKGYKKVSGKDKKHLINVFRTIE